MHRVTRFGVYRHPKAIRKKMGSTRNNYFMVRSYIVFYLVQDGCRFREVADFRRGV